MVTRRVAQRRGVLLFPAKIIFTVYMWPSDPSDLEDHFVTCPLPLVFGFGKIIYSFYHSGLGNCVLQVSIQMVGVLIN